MRLTSKFIAVFVLGMTLGGCGTIFDTRCWTSMDSAPCYCSNSGNPCCETPKPPACHGGNAEDAKRADGGLR